MDVEVRIHRLGPEGTDDPAVVLVHGLGQSRRYWEPLATSVARYLPVLVVELPGYGQTRRPPKEMSIDGLGAALLRALEQLDVREVILVGHSMGSQVVASAAAQAPAFVHSSLLVSPVVAPWQRTTPKLLAKFAAASFVEINPSLMHRQVYSFVATTVKRPVWMWEQFHAMKRYRLEHTLSQVAPSERVVIVSGSRDKLATLKFLRYLVQILTAAGVDATWRAFPRASHNIVVTHVPWLTDLICEVAGWKPKSAHADAAALDQEMRWD